MQIKIGVQFYPFTSLLGCYKTSIPSAPDVNVYPARNQGPTHVAAKVIKHIHSRLYARFLILTLTRFLHPASALDGKKKSSDPPRFVFMRVERGEICKQIPARISSPAVVTRRCCDLRFRFVCFF